MKVNSLNEIVKERSDKEKELISETNCFNKKRDKLNSKIDELKRLEEIALLGFNIGWIQIALHYLDCRGDINGIIDNGSKPLSELAIIDISNDCKHMKKMYFGNKRYEGLYQRSNHTYGMGPSHGSIVDRIGLRDPKKELSSNEKDACIYFLKKYDQIMEALKK